MFWLSPSQTFIFIRLMRRPPATFFLPLPLHQRSASAFTSFSIHQRWPLHQGSVNYNQHSRTRHRPWWRGCWTKWRWKKKENSKRIQTDSTLVDQSSIGLFGFFHSFAWKQWPTFSYINLTVGHHCFQYSLPLPLPTSTSSQWLMLRLVSNSLKV